MWAIFGIIAAALWGITYVFSERIYAQISISTSLALGGIVSSLVMLAFAMITGRFTSDLSTIVNHRGLTWLLVAEMVAFSAAEVFIALSITSKNATLAGLIEISYPIFIALFAYLIFKEKQGGLATAIGGALIFLGIFVIYNFNK